ncbi:hypothetical protein [Nocardioides sp. SYSU D00065]|uniref:hypothetical protein n=1 Tax=Nocardioides sp. SYSU D00065 TaxID=2817378 RepID=UPI001B31F356|nr:hypothetical protein [Nocardioides sp. SYSU D00065]
MNPIRTVTGAISHPVRTAGAVAGATIGASVGAASAGLRTTARVVGWAVERTTGAGPDPVASPFTGDEQAAPAAAEPAAETPAEAPVKKTAAKKTAAKKAPAKKAAAESPAKKAAAKKTAAKKAAAKKTARKAPSEKAAVLAPALGLSEDEVEDDLRTPSGIPAAGDAVNPDTTDTDLHQVGTEPLVDPSTVKAVASESEMLGRAADPDKG